MSRALVSIGVGPHAELLDIALPSFHDFADRHGYDVVLPDLDCSRPPSWWKIPALTAALAEYGEVLWVDADVVIVDPSEDFPATDDCWQAMVEHHTGDGRVPNLGVWFVRRPMLPTLQRIWSMVEYLDHPWWEQAAMVQLLGYGGAPLGPLAYSELAERTWLVDQAWNVHVNDVREVEHPRFQHATMQPDRAAAMRDWAGSCREGRQWAVAS